MRCTYLDEYENREESVVAEDFTASISAEGKWSAQILDEVRQWRESRIIPPLAYFAPKVHLPIGVYSEDELCYLNHIMKLYHKLEASGLCHLTVLSNFMPRFDVLLELNLVYLC